MFERSYLENIIRNAPIGIITTDLQRRITFMSELARRTCQLSDDMTGHPIDQLAAEPAAMQDQLARVLGGQVQRLLFEVEVNAPVGRRVVQFTSTLLRDDAYVTIGLLVMCEDVTEKRETERKYGTLMANSRDPVVLFKAERLLEVNGAFAAMVGRSPEACRDMAWGDFIDPDTLPIVVDLVQRRTAGDETVPDTFDLYAHDATGDRRLFNVTVSPVFADRGVYSMILRDITERKLLEERIAETKKLESLGLLAGGIAHDFNNLLSGVMGYSSLLKTKLDPESAEFRYADRIETSSTHAKELTAQLLAFARGGQYEVQPLNLNHTVLEAVRMLRLSMPRGVKLTTKLTSRLNWIEADPAQMHQIIANLFTNAIEAMASGGRVTIRTENVRFNGSPGADTPHLDPGPYVHLSLSDTGRGISDEALPRIFDPFFSSKGVGHGLGLSAVYGIVRNHRGAVTVESQIGSGTTVHVYLPAAAAPHREQRRIMEPVERGRETVLVVDDEAIIRDLLGRILEELGYRAIITATGEEAIEAFRARHGEIDCVILDMVLPDLNGDEVFSEMRRIQPDARVVLCTGYSIKPAIEEMVRQGVAGVIRKPFQIEELSATIRSALDRSPSAPQA
ncbi:MAG: response regulator [Verrucomicrobia bacterium]|nr:response regulator [Verrucomicrobiota bacterium]